MLVNKTSDKEYLQTNCLKIFTARCYVQRSIATASCPSCLSVTSSHRLEYFEKTIMADSSLSTDPNITLRETSTGIDLWVRYGTRSQAVARKADSTAHSSSDCC